MIKCITHDERPGALLKTNVPNDADCRLVMARGRRCRGVSSKPDATGDPRAEGLMHVKSIETQSLPVGVVWKFGKEVQLMYRPRHLTEVQN
ncbi:hypothetical protein TNCV_2981951 [Trichonephila clavipes]|nr:hypothetical protein TNCV_2981951 [Trichonephila clavipes]